RRAQRRREASAFRSPRGRWIIAPSASGAKAATPRSMPVSCPVGSSGPAGTSAQEQQADQPATSRLIVTDLGAPSLRRDQRTATRPIVASARTPSSRAAPLPPRWEGTLFSWLLPLPRGYAGVSPA